MNIVLILAFNILASCQAKPDADTNMHINEASISMEPKGEIGGGDYSRTIVGEEAVMQGSVHPGPRLRGFNRL